MRCIAARREDALASILVLLLAGGMSAQEPPDSVALTGWIVDATSREPLSSAYVVHEESGVRRVTGGGGAFRLVLPRSGSARRYELRAGRFGYLEMHFEIGEELVGEMIILPLEVEPIALEGLDVTVDRLAELEERLDRRTRAYDGPARSLDAERIGRMGAPSALDLVLSGSTGLFECWESPGELCARPRQVVTLRGPPPRETPVLVCLDERKLWGGTAELLAIPSDEIYRVELYGFGGRNQVRLYTRWFMARRSGGERQALPPASFGC